MALLNTYQDSLFALSLRRLFSSYSGPLVRVVRESDFVEVDVLPDANGEISYDSLLSRPAGTQASTLGQFLNVDGYTDVDSLGSVYEGRLIIIYDQSVGGNHVSYDVYANSFLFVEHSLPAIFPNSTGIIKVSGVPSFFAVGTSKTFTPATLLGTEYSVHFLSGQVGTNPIGFRVQGIDTNGFFTNPYDVLLYTNSATTVFQPSGSTDVFNVNDVYINTEQCNETQNNVFAKPTNQNESTVINSIEFAFFDNATTQANFSAAVDGPSFYIVSNSFYADIIVYEGYDNIRRLFIEDLYSTAADNVETKFVLSSFSFEEESNQDNGFIAQFPNPAAAYSVRDLRGGVDDQGDRVTKIMRVRREIDHAEADVYPDSTGWLSLDSPVEIVPAITGNLEGGTGDEIDSLAVTLGEFVNDPDHNNPDNLVSATTAKVVVWYDQSDPDYLVDNLPESIQERGAPIRIRVIGGTYDNYEFDVYFDNNETISLSSYVADTYEITDSNGQVTAARSNGTLQTLLDAGMTEAAVCVWYDQSGSGNDASQDVSTAQPKIISERTNLLPDSQDFTQWQNLGGATLTPNTATAPDGTATATSWASPTSTYRILRTVPQALSASTNYVFSFYVKNINASNAAYRVYNNSTGSDVVPATSYISQINTSDWTRIEVQFTTSATPTDQYTCYVGSSSFTGEILFWGAQLEEGDTATDYIPTNGSAVTVSEVITESGKPAVEFTRASSQYLENTNDIMTGPNLCLVSVFKGTSTLTETRFIVDQSGANYGGTLAIGSGNKFEASARFAGTFVGFGTSIESTAQHLLFGNWVSGGSYFSIDGTVAASSATTFSGSGSPAVPFWIGGDSQTNLRYVDGNLQEIIVYNSSQDDNRSGIELAINNYYDIYGSNNGLNIKFLDDNFYPNAAAAYSLRKLRTAYGGPVNLSGRKDAKQQVATSQPTIYDSSTGVINISGNPALEFDGTGDILIGAAKTTISNTSIFCVIQSDSNTQDSVFIQTALNADNLVALGLGNKGTSNAIGSRLRVGASNIDSVGDGTFTATDQTLVSYIADNTNGQMFVDGTQETDSIDSRSGGSDTAIGGRPDNQNYYDGKIQEVVFYDSNQSNNRPDIENNINSAFQIYAANFSSVLDTVPLAKGAYGLRRLTKQHINPIITLDNGSATKDFYADFWGNLDVDAITSFANGGTLSITKWWDQSGRNYHLLGEYTDKPTLNTTNGELSIDTTNKFTLPLLDRYSGAAAAYSLRELSSSYTGPLVRVRRDGTNTEVDVYPDANGELSLDSPVSNVSESTTGVTVTELETSATNLGEFVADAGYTNVDGLAGTVNAFVVVWYDQSNSNDASQDVSTSQPKIYAAGTNLLLQSNTFDTTWNTGGGTLTSGQLGYDGTNSAWRFQNPTTTAPVYQTNTSSGVQTLSAYFKKNATYGVRLYAFGTTNANAFFNLNTGNVVNQTNTISANIEAIGSDWFRCSITFDSTLTRCDFYVTNNASTQVLGEYTIQDAQLTPSDTVTDYIETTTSAISEGALITENGKPAVQFDGSNDFITPVTSTASDYTMHAVTKNSSVSSYLFDSQTGRFIFDVRGTSVYYDGTHRGSPHTGTTQQLQSIYAVAPSSGQSYLNGTQINTGLGYVEKALGGTTRLGGAYYGDARIIGTIQEFVIYASDQSANRTGIESNINDYYSIYTPSTTPTSQSIAVYGNAINESIDLNANYTDLKEIIIYE